MLHRAVLGSIERFIGILIENHSGHLPLWLAPVQVVVATITHDGDDFARKVARTVGAAGMRVALDTSNEKIGFKVRLHSVAKIPLLFAIGKREAAEGTVAIRRLGSKDQEILALDEAVARLEKEATPPA
jgi:threonyl-tRNA synthetase